MSQAASINLRYKNWEIAALPINWLWESEQRSQVIRIKTDEFNHQLNVVLREQQNKTSTEFLNELAELISDIARHFEEMGLAIDELTNSFAAFCGARLNMVFKDDIIFENDFLEDRVEEMSKYLKKKIFESDWQLLEAYQQSRKNKYRAESAEDKYIQFAGVQKKKEKNDLITDIVKDVWQELDLSSLKSRTTEVANILCAIIFPELAKHIAPIKMTGDLENIRKNAIAEILRLLNTHTKAEIRTSVEKQKYVLSLLEKCASKSISASLEEAGVINVDDVVYVSLTEMAKLDTKRSFQNPMGFLFDDPECQEANNFRLAYKNLISSCACYNIQFQECVDAQLDISEISSIIGVRYLSKILSESEINISPEKCYEVIRNNCLKNIAAIGMTINILGALNNTDTGLPDFF